MSLEAYWDVWMEKTFDSHDDPVRESQAVP